MRIAILHDFTQNQCPGGADLTLARLLETAPKQIEVSWLAVSNPLQWSYRQHLIVANTRSIGNVELERLLEGKQYVKIHFDYGFVSPKVVRGANLLVYMSPRQKIDMLGSLTGYNFHIMPSLVDPDLFYPAEYPRKGYLWVGNYSRQKGIRHLFEYAEANQVCVDCFGHGTSRVYLEQSEYCHVKAAVPYIEVPSLLRQYRTLIHLPKGPEAGSRTFIEAVLSGLNIITNSFEGNLSFVDPYNAQKWRERLRKAPHEFWKQVLQILK